MKLVIIMLFSDSVKVSSQLVISVGVMIGRVIWKNIFRCFVLRFIVVFFSEWFSFCRCEDIIIVMNDRVKVICVIQIVIMLWFGKLGMLFIDISRVISENLRIIFGIISGVVISVLNIVLFGNWWKWVIIIVVIVFSIVVVVVVQKVIFRLIYNVFRICWLLNSLLYQWVENFDYIVVSLEVLKEYIINSRIGRYRKVKFSFSMFQFSQWLLCIMFMIVFFLVCVVGSG